MELNKFSTSIWLLCSCLLATQPAFAQSETVDPTADPFADPFSSDPFSTDPFSTDQTEEQEESTAEHQTRVEWKSFYQVSNERDNHPFNPGLVPFSDYRRETMLDMNWSTRWNDQWRSKFRVYSSWHGSEVNTGFDTWLLEGSVQWQSDNRNWVVEAGRIKPQWSNGYNWDIANLLQPMRNRPYIDQDDPLQNKGWDMVSVQYFVDSWNFSGYVIDSDQVNADVEAVLRMAWQGAQSYSFLIHKVEGIKPAYAATFSTLLTDDMTIRAEWSAHPQRQIPFLKQAVDDKSYYHRWVVGTTFSHPEGWSLTAEYFNNQHGFDESEWDAFANATRESRINYLNQQANGADFEQLFGSLNVLRSGWMKKHYGSLMFMSAESEDLWSIRASIQASLDDGSQLHRIEILKSFSDAWTGRFQLEAFQGCDYCEYGLNPNEQTARLVISRIW